LTDLPIHVGVDCCEQFGIASGGEGGGGQGRGSVMEAWLYDPNAPVGQRFTILAATTIQRHYHSVAFLLPDGDIFVAGSEQSESCYCSPHTVCIQMLVC
jgi:hypothetical protein